MTGCIGWGSALAASAQLSQLPDAASPVTTPDWSAYLNGPSHTSYSPTQTAITPASASNLVQKWHDMTGQDFLASPTVASGAVFIGSDNGWFYKLNETTGAVEHKAFLGYRQQNLCGAHGIVDTATVAVSPRTHRPTVYVGSANGYLYAFNASSLSLEWKSVIAIPSPTVTDYYEWSSPTVAHGKIYIGVSSDCDSPLIRGGLIGYNQATGKKLGEFYTVPAGANNYGGSIWSSVAVAPNGDVYASTGNGPYGHFRLAYSESVLKLTSKLRLLGSWKVPRRQNVYDGDFGASPVVFGHYVGACNKNGIFYALRQSNMRVAWERRIGRTSSGPVLAACLATPVYNGRYLFFGGTAVTLKGKSYRGSVQERLASNGRLVWETGLPNGVIGSPAMDGGGVIAVGTYDNSGAPNRTYLVDAATGKILRTLVRGDDFAQSIFAEDWLFTANSDGVFAWGPRRH